MRCAVDNLCAINLVTFMCVRGCVCVYWKHSDNFLYEPIISHWLRTAADVNEWEKIAKTDCRYERVRLCEPSSNCTCVNNNNSNRYTANQQENIMCVYAVAAAIQNAAKKEALGVYGSRECIINSHICNVHFTHCIRIRNWLLQAIKLTKWFSREMVGFTAFVCLFYFYPWMHTCADEDGERATATATATAAAAQ